MFYKKLLQPVDFSKVVCVDCFIGFCSMHSPIFGGCWKTWEQIDSHLEQLMHMVWRRHGYKLLFETVAVC